MSHATRSGATDALDAALFTVHLDIVGLDCADCARTVEQRVAGMQGVQEARLNFATARLTARVDAGRVRTRDIAAEVEAAGYAARELGSPSPEARRMGPFVGPWAAPVALSGLALAAGLLAALAGAPEAVRAALFGAAIVLAGSRVARAAVGAVHARRALDMNVLMTIAAVGAVLIGEWAEGAMAMFLFGLGNLLEGYTTDRARAAIRELMALAPAVARVRRDGGEIAVPAEEVRPGDVVIVKPGERLPVDGTVLSGASPINEAPLTGESVPADKRPGDDVFAGTINGPGALEIRATRQASDTMLAKIVHLVEEAQASRAPAQRFVDRFAEVYTPVVILTALAIVLVMPVLTGQAVSVWFYRALVLLVIACPCALVLSTPVSIVSAISAAAKRGVLVKGGAHLEAAGTLRAIAVDKTGTLTEGRPAVTDVVALDGVGRDEVLALAAAVESRSEHPLAHAIVHEARHLGLAVPAVADFEALLGRGARGRVNGAWLVIGSRESVPPGTALGEAEAILDRLEREGKTAMLVTRDREPIGVVAVADRLRPDAARALQAIREAGMEHVVMLTGDNPVTARAIADQLGLREVRAGLLPADKAGAVAALRDEHGPVGMIGDGVNDAPALATATVGIAVTGGGVAGSDAALETADIVLMSGDLDRLPYVLRLSKRTRRTIAANIAFSLGVKAVFLTLATAGLATLWMAVLADVGTSVAVVLNGMRLLRSDGERKA